MNGDDIRDQVPSKDLGCSAWLESEHRVQYSWDVEHEPRARGRIFGPIYTSWKFIFVLDFTMTVMKPDLKKWAAYVQLNTKSEWLQEKAQLGWGKKRKKKENARNVNKENTVKASNFGPFFFASSVASLDESCTKNEQNRFCRSKVFLQLSFSSFFCRTCFNDSNPFWKRGPKLETLTVLIRKGGKGDNRVSAQLKIFSSLCCEKKGSFDSQKATSRRQRDSTDLESKLEKLNFLTEWQNGGRHWPKSALCWSGVPGLWISGT